MTVPSEQKHCHLQRKEIIPPIIKVHTHSGEALSEPPQNPIGDILLYTVFTTGNISNTDLCLRPYRSGRDYCSEFDYLLYNQWTY